MSLFFNTFGSKILKVKKYIIHRLHILHHPLACTFLFLWLFSTPPSAGAKHKEMRYVILPISQTKALKLWARASGNKFRHHEVQLAIFLPGRDLLVEEVDSNPLVTKNVGITFLNTHIHKISWFQPILLAPSLKQDQSAPKYFSRSPKNMLIRQIAIKIFCLLVGCCLGVYPQVSRRFL